MSPNQQYFTSLDKSGRVLVFSSLTKTLVYEFKMSGSADSACFSADGRYLFTEGSESEIYQWELGSQKLFKRIQDEGCVKNTGLCVSPNGQYLASGCSSGVVNVYNIEKTLPDHPVKNILNLTTAITSMKMNSTSELMAISSKWKKNAVKLIHLPSLTTYSNFPSVRTNLKFATALDFK